MYSLDYIFAHTRFLRRVLRWNNSKKIARYQKAEENRFTANALDLRNFEQKTFSQNGEDGIIQEIFRRIGTTNQFFVEFGIEDGRECNTRYLMEKKGWRGLWMDGSDKNCQSARSLANSFNTQVVNTFITAENIENLLLQANVPAELDLLSIDIDGNDYWVWKSITSFRPRVLIVEYNASYPPPLNYVMPYKSDHMFDGTRHFGASLTELVALGEQKGYKLIACDKAGVNAFFLRQDLMSDKFITKDLNYFYSCPKYGSFFFGHAKGKGPWMKK